MSNVVYVGTRGSRHIRGELAPVVQGTTDSLHIITVQYTDESTYDLTGKVVSGTMYRSKTEETFAITGNLSLVSAAAGTFSWDKSAADVGTPGTFDVQFVITAVDDNETDVTFEAPMTIEEQAEADSVVLRSIIWGGDATTTPFGTLYGGNAEGV